MRKKRRCVDRGGKEEQGDGVGWKQTERKASNKQRGMREKVQEWAGRSDVQRSREKERKEERAWRKRREWLGERGGTGAPQHYSGSSSWPEMLIQRFNKSMPLEKYNASPHWVDVRGLRKCILKYFTLRGNNVLIYNSSPYTLGLSICVSDLTS